MSYSFYFFIGFTLSWAFMFTYCSSKRKLDFYDVCFAFSMAVAWPLTIVLMAFFGLTLPYWKKKYNIDTKEDE